MSSRPNRHKRKSDDKKRRDSHDPAPRKQHRTVTSVSSGQLPKWVREEIQRSTPKDRRDPALNHLAKALNQFADERYSAALPELRLIYAGGEALSLGDPIFMRHSKAGELCERFNTLLLVSDGVVVGEAPTYRGEGQAFL